MAFYDILYRLSGTKIKKSTFYFLNEKRYKLEIPKIFYSLPHDGIKNQKLEYGLFFMSIGLINFFIEEN